MPESYPERDHVWRSEGRLLRASGQRPEEVHYARAEEDRPDDSGPGGAFHGETKNLRFRRHLYTPPRRRRGPSKERCLHLGRDGVSDGLLTRTPDLRGRRISPGTEQDQVARDPRRARCGGGGHKLERGDKPVHRPGFTQCHQIRTGSHRNLHLRSMARARKRWPSRSPRGLSPPESSTALS
jgi:hypothetical protein